MRIFLIFFLTFFFASSSNASVVGKGLSCKVSENNLFFVQDFPLFYYFFDENLYENFSIKGYEIVGTLQPYSLVRPNQIKFSGNLTGILNRETLELRIANNLYSCKVYRSRNAIIDKMKQIITKAKSNNKL